MSVANIDPGREQEIRSWFLSIDVTDERHGKEAWLAVRDLIALLDSARARLKTARVMIDDALAVLGREAQG